MAEKPSKADCLDCAKSSINCCQAHRGDKRKVVVPTSEEFDAAQAESRKSSIEKHLEHRSKFAHEQMLRECAELAKRVANIEKAVAEGMQPMEVDTNWLASTATKVERLVVEWVTAERALFVVRNDSAKLPRGARS